MKEGFSKSNPRTGPSTITKKGLTHWGGMKQPGQEPESECWKCGYVGKDFIWGNNSVKCPSCGKTFKNFEEERDTCVCGHSIDDHEHTTTRCKLCKNCSGFADPSLTKSSKMRANRLKQSMKEVQERRHGEDYVISQTVKKLKRQGQKNLTYGQIAQQLKKDFPEWSKFSDYELSMSIDQHLANKKLKEGFNKPGARGTIVTKTCLTCKGRGSPAPTTTPEQYPCKACKGTGKTWKSVPYPGQGKNHPYKTDTNPYDITDQVIDAVAKGVAIPTMSDSEKREAEQHVRNLPPAKVAHLAKSMTKEGSKTPRFTPSEIKSQKIGLDKALKSNRFTPQEKKGMKDEMSTVGGIGGFNAPMGTDRKGIKHNFKVEEMKTLRRLVKEATAKSKPPMDLSKVAHSFTSFIDKKSKSGELQKQFGSGYSPEKFMAWLESETEKEGCHVSDEYLRKLKSRLTGQAVKDMKTVYFADLKGAGLGVGQLNKQSKGDDDVIDEEEWQ